MNPKIIFSNPLHSTKKIPQWHYCLELIDSIEKNIPTNNYIHIIINDASTDEAANIISKRIKGKDNYILININERNGTTAFNLGIDISIDPEKHSNLLKQSQIKTIKKFSPDFISFIGVDDLYSKNYYELLKEAIKYPKKYVLFYGNYKSFLKHECQSRVEFSPYRRDLKETFAKLMRSENFPSHTLIFRPNFVRQLRNYRKQAIGILDPKLLSPIAYDMMLEATKLSIEKNYKFGFLLGNFGYKRYGIKGTMTNLNKKTGKYKAERDLVYNRNKSYLKKYNIKYSDKRPRLDELYFSRLNKNKLRIEDDYLKTIVKPRNFYKL